MWSVPADVSTLSATGIMGASWAMADPHIMLMFGPGPRPRPLRRPLFGALLTGKMIRNRRDCCHLGYCYQRLPDHKLTLGIYPRSHGRKRMR